jgi:hypothetical protein
MGHPNHHTLAIYDDFTLTYEVLTLVDLVVPYNEKEDLSYHGEHHP